MRLIPLVRAGVDFIDNTRAEWRSAALALAGGHAIDPETENPDPAPFL